MVDLEGPECRLFQGSTLYWVHPRAVSTAAASLIGGAACHVTAVHRHGASLQVPGRPDVLFLSPLGHGLLPLHVLVDASVFEQILTRNLEALNGAEFHFALEGVRRFTVRIHADPNGMASHQARSSVEALAAWLGHLPDENGLGQATAELLAPGGRWQTVLGPGNDSAMESLRSLLGRGTGTTPAGDDFLLGALAHAWALEGGRAPLIRRLGSIAESFEHLTTSTSGTYLRAALRGEFSSHLASFVRALPRADWGQILQRARRVLDHGSTSGLDTLIGFLAAACYTPRPALEAPSGTPERAP